MLQQFGYCKYRWMIAAVLVAAAAGLTILERELTFAAALGIGAGLFATAKRHQQPDWKELLMRAIESTPAGLCMFDAESRVILSNHQFARMYGLCKADLGPGIAVRNDLARRLAALGAVKRAEYGADFDHGKPAGSTEHVEGLNDGRFISVSRHVMAGGGFVEVHRDITRERVAEDRANEAMQELIEKQYAVDQAVIVAITDVKGAITYANDNFCRISEYSREELVGQDHRILNSGTHPQALFREMYRCLASGKVWRGELCNRSKSGGLYWVDTVITPQLGPEGKPIAYIAIRIDITARKNAEARIEYAATHDALTGLLNRSAFVEQAKAELRGDGDNWCAVHLIDLDGFKGVNDTLGHSAGDDLLRQVSLRLRAQVVSEDLVARLGGDEFAVLQRMHVLEPEPAIRLSRRIVEAMAEPFVVNDHRVNIGASIGTALSPEHGCSMGDLLKKADLALYEVKADAGNGFRLYQPAMLQAIEVEKALERSLRNALAEGQFELHYQPVVDVRNRSLVAAEALVRWRNSGNELVSPLQFIPVAERSGLILPLGEWIIQQACLDAVSWSSDIQLAINVSAIQFKKGNLFDVVMQALLRSGLCPQRLQIEVTETALLEHQSGQLRTFRQLKNMGVTLVLDDFGTGYSSATYLTNFPFDKIKIDKSFIQGLPKRECAAVIASAVALAKGLGITITAEGIETESQRKDLQAMGIDFGQGYLFSPPVPLQEFISVQCNPNDPCYRGPDQKNPTESFLHKKLAN